MFVEMNCVIF